MTRRQPANKRKLSELFVKRARPKSKAHLIWDTKQSGLALRMRPTGNRSWFFIYSRHGRPRWYRIGDAKAIDLADARTLAAEAALAVAKGGDPAADRKAQRSRGTFEELAAQYVREYASKQNKSWKQADTLVRRYVIPKWGKLQAAAITRNDVKTLMSDIAAPVLADQVLAAASAIFTWAIKEKLLLENPCRLVDRNPTASRERVLSDSEVPKFWRAFDSAGLIAGTALKTILLTGQRPGEVAHMRREHIADGWWNMPGAPVEALGWPGTKNGENHRVCLPLAVQALIAELGDGESGFVFANERGGNVTKLDGVMRTICADLKAERATPHDLRRTHGTTITGLGFGREAMNRVQNHIEGGMGGIYDRHDYGPQNKLVMGAVAARIMAIIEGTVDNADNVVPVQFR